MKAQKIEPNPLSEEQLKVQKIVNEDIKRVSGVNPYMLDDITLKTKDILGINSRILTPTEGLSKPDWLRCRQKGIGGSDISSLCGLNKWKSPLALWHEKTEKIEDEEEENLPAELGIYLEPFMKGRFEKWVKKEEGHKVSVKNMPYIFQHVTNDIALANLDGVFSHPDKMVCVAEYKTTSEFFYKQWQDENIPDNYYLQVQWYLYVTDLKYCYLSFLIGNRKFDVLIIERNQGVIDEIVEKADFFWKTYVLPKIAPAPSGDISSGEALKSMYPKEEEGTTVDFTGDGDLEHNFVKVDFVNEQIKGLIEEREVNKQAIKAKQGIAEVLICGEKKSVWKEQEKKGYTVKASTSRVFRISKYKGGRLTG